MESIGLLALERWQTKLIVAGVGLVLLVSAAVLLRLFSNNERGLMIVSLIVGFLGIAAFGAIGNFGPPEDEAMLGIPVKFVLIGAGSIGLIGLATGAFAYSKLKDERLQDEQDQA